MDCAGDYPSMYIYAVGLRNSEDLVPAMGAHGGLKALFILILSVLVLHIICFILRIFVSGSFTFS